MLDSIRRSVAIPQIPVGAVLSAGILGSFCWLLVQGAIQPLALYCLQVYLTF
jgi:hypothetical protein